MSFEACEKEIKDFVDFGFTAWVSMAATEDLAAKVSDMLIRWGRAGVAPALVMPRIRRVAGEATSDDKCVKILAAFECKSGMIYDPDANVFIGVPRSTGVSAVAQGSQSDLSARLDDMMKLLTLQNEEIARLRAQAEPPVPPREVLSLYAIDAFTQREHLPQWAKDVTAALRVALLALRGDVMEEHSPEADFKVDPAEGVWQEMATSIFDVVVKNQNTYEKRYQSRGTEGISSQLRTRNGEQFWVTKRGEWLPTKDPPKLLCRRCLDKGRPKAEAAHWFFQCPDFA